MFAIKRNLILYKVGWRLICNYNQSTDVSFMKMNFSLWSDFNANTRITNAIWCWQKVNEWSDGLTILLLFVIQFHKWLHLNSVPINKANLYKNRKINRFPILMTATIFAQLTLFSIQQIWKVKEGDIHTQKHLKRSTEHT